MPTGSNTTIDVKLPIAAGARPSTRRGSEGGAATGVAPPFAPAGSDDEQADDNEAAASTAAKRRLGQHKEEKDIPPILCGRKTNAKRRALASPVASRFD